MKIISQDKILVIDNDEEVRDQYINLFKEDGFIVLGAKDGIDALKLIANENDIKVIFTGITMSRMDGFELVKTLKADKETAKIPIIINAPLVEEEDKKRMEELGVKDFIIRGVTSPAEVLKRVKQVIQRGEYWLGISPLELDEQKIIEDFNLPEDLKCRNCGTRLALDLKVSQAKKLVGGVACPNCKLKY